MLSFFPRDVLGEIWDLTESVSEGLPTYSYVIFVSEVGSKINSNLPIFNNPMSFHLILYKSASINLIIPHVPVPYTRHLAREYVSYGRIPVFSYETFAFSFCLST